VLSCLCYQCRLNLEGAALVKISSSLVAACWLIGTAIKVLWWDRLGQTLISFAWWGFAPRHLKCSMIRIQSRLRSPAEALNQVFHPGPSLGDYQQKNCRSLK